MFEFCIVLYIVYIKCFHIECRTRYYKYHNKVLSVFMSQIFDRHKGIWVLWGQDLVQCHLPEEEDIPGSLKYDGNFRGFALDIHGL